MRLLGDVHLIENENLVPPTIGTRAIPVNQASKLKSVIMETTTVVVYKSMIGSHCCEKTVAK